jgi:nucleoside-diphosphate-sugar epimerase
MKCLVTGGAGFIGSHLCENLLKKGHEVICFDNFSTGSKKNVNFDNKNFTIEKGDTNTSDLVNVFKKHEFNWVFHHSAVVGVKRTLEKPIEVLNDIKGTRNILELCRKNDVDKTLFASSSEVYGEPVQIPGIENGHLNPKIPYSVTKLMGEKYFEAYYQTYGLKTCSLRFFNVYGPKQNSSDYGFVTGIFIKKLLNNKSPIIFGDGTQTRDFIYINDNIKATIKAMETNKTNGQVINIGTGRPMTILDLAETIIKLTNKNLKPVFEQVRDDVRHRFPDVSKMIKLLNYRPQYNIEEGLIKTIEYYKSIQN